MLSLAIIIILMTMIKLMIMMKLVMILMILYMNGMSLEIMHQVEENLQGKRKIPVFLIL